MIEPPIDERPARDRDREQEIADERADHWHDQAVDREAVDRESEP